MNRRIIFVIPGKLDQFTGGYLFDRRVIEGLRHRHQTVKVIELPGNFPITDTTARNAAKVLVDTLDPESVLIIDGLALPAFERLLPIVQGTPAIGFVHHPLFLETGLTKERISYFTSLESSLWQALDGIICASASTARSVLGCGVDEVRIKIASPGVDKVTLPSRVKAVGNYADALGLLCVATITQRKGHHTLVEALATLREYPWTLDCYGSLDRDPDTVKTLRNLIIDNALVDRIRLHGEQSAENLEQAWKEADLFVLASYHEGYGMVLTEAIAHGLPIVSTNVGAIPETVPTGTSILVDPGDKDALAQALKELILNTNRLSAMRQAAITASKTLVIWPQAIAHWSDALEEILGLERIQSRQMPI